MNKFLGYLFYSAACFCCWCGFFAAGSMFGNGLFGAIKSFQVLNDSYENKLNFVAYTFEFGFFWIPMLFGAIGSRIWSELAEYQFNKS